VVPTGTSIALPEGFVGYVMPRSGLAAKHGISLVNAPGAIDAGYRGEIKVRIHNDSRTPFSFEVGDRIAQGIVIPVSRTYMELVHTLTDTSRGDGGFGSTGA
jgi:dUTP pyrophosphatase